MGYQGRYGNMGGKYGGEELEDWIWEFWNRIWRRMARGVEGKSNCTNNEKG